MSTQAERANGDRIGQVLGRYRIVSLIAEGRAGAVYVAEHVMMRKRFALKLLHPEMARDAEAVARLRREAVAASQLEHPNVVAVTDVGRTDDGAFFLVMEYVLGTSLRAELASGPLSARRAVRVARQIALALSRAHRAGIVHRDIKPENVMLVRQPDGSELVKVVDFGVAGFDPASGQGGAQQALTRAGAILGSPEYMAPEQAVGESATLASDLYALGVVFFEMLADRRPLDGDLSEMISQHVLGQVPRIADRAPDVRVPEPIEAVVYRLLAKDPSARYPSAEALVEAIDEAAGRSLPDAPITPRAYAGTAAGPGEGPPASRGRLEAVRAGVVAAVARLSGGAQAAMRSRYRPVAFAALGLVALSPLLIGVLVVRRVVSSSAAATEARGLVASAAKSTGAAPPEQIRHAAARGIPALEELAGEFPADGAIVHELAFAYDAASRPSDALRAVERAASLGKGPLPKDLVRIVVRATSKLDTADEAFRLLEGPLGADGVEALLHLSSDTSLPQETRARASWSLAKPSVRKNASEATAFLIDLRAATTCEAKRQVLGRAGQQADGRALPTLRTLKKAYGCGRRGTEDCHRCLRGDPSLDRAIAAAEARDTQ